MHPYIAKNATYGPPAIDGIGQSGILPPLLRDQDDNHPTPRNALLHLLQVEGDANAVHQNGALIDQILIGDFSLNELAQGL